MSVSSPGLFLQPVVCPRLQVPACPVRPLGLLGGFPDFCLSPGAGCSVWSSADHHPPPCCRVQAMALGRHSPAHPPVLTCVLCPPPPPRGVERGKAAFFSLFCVCSSQHRGTVLLPQELQNQQPSPTLICHHSDPRGDTVTPASLNLVRHWPIQNIEVSGTISCWCHHHGSCRWPITLLKATGGSARTCVSNSHSSRSPQRECRC